MRTAPISPASRLCALSLAAPCAHLSSDLVAGAAQVQSQLRYLKSTSSAPRRSGRDCRRINRSAGTRDCRSNSRCAPARLLAHVWKHPSTLQAFALLSSLKSTSSAPRRSGRDRRKSDRGAGTRDCGSNSRCAPARLLAHVWLHPSALQAFALLSSLHDARHDARALRCGRRGGRCRLRRCRCAGCVAVRCAAPRQPSSETVRRGAC